MPNAKKKRRSTEDSLKGNPPRKPRVTPWEKVQ